MMSADTQTDLAIHFKPARGGEEAERGWTQRVGRWENDTTVIDSLGIRGVGRAGEGKVPFKEIGLERRSMEAWVWVGGELGGFFEDAFDGRGFGVESWERHSYIGVGSEKRHDRVQVLVGCHIEDFSHGYLIN